jgi:hypothetical protein
MSVGTFVNPARPGWLSLSIPAACTVVAQYMQHIHAVGYDVRNIASYALYSPLFLFSFIKIIAIVVLAVHVARLLIVERNAAAMPYDLRRADRYLGLLLGLNIGLAGFLILAMQLINGEALAAMGISRTAAKVALAGLVLLALRQLNKRVLHDIASAVAGVDLRQLPLPDDANRTFLRQLTRNGVKYALPLFAVHAVIAIGVPRESGLFLAAAAADSLLVALLGLAVGYATFLSYDAVVAGSAKERP